MKLSWLLFDADNTLLDFTSASKASLWQSFQDFDVECNAEIYSIYKKINASVWAEFEKGKISAIELRKKRFADLFDVIGKSDLEPSEFSKAYLDNLVIKSEAYEGVVELLQSLQKKYRISLVTNGLKEVQRPRLSKLNLNQYFESIIVSDEIGSAKPDREFFEHTFLSIPNPPEKSEVMIIGDNPVSDIQGGIDFGIRTCLVTNGVKKGAEVQSDLVVEKANDLLGILL